jgi:hypothetical protein
LLALRNPLRTPTTIAAPRYSEFPPDAFDTLFQRRFVIQPDDAHEGAAAEDVCALLSGHRDLPVLRVDRDFARPARSDDREAARALAWLIEHLDRRTVELVIEPGDLVMLNNRRVVHGRRQFQAKYDGRDRWLKRINIAIDLARTVPGRSDVRMRVIG